MFFKYVIYKTIKFLNRREGGHNTKRTIFYQIIKFKKMIKFFYLTAFNCAVQKIFNTAILFKISIASNLRSKLERWLPACHLAAN